MIHDTLAFDSNTLAIFIDCETFIDRIHINAETFPILVKSIQLVRSD